MSRQLIHAVIFLVAVFAGFFGLSRIACADCDLTEVTSIDLTPQPSTVGDVGSQTAGLTQPEGHEEDVLEIPSLLLELPLQIVSSTKPADFVQPLNRGVALYPGAAPGELGRAVILGHSAAPNWPKIRYDWAFSDIGKLQAGQEIKATYGKETFTYVVRTKKIILKGAQLPLMTGNGGELVLITCWPPGVDYKRMIVIADLQS